MIIPMKTHPGCLVGLTRGWWSVIALWSALAAAAAPEAPAPAKPFTLFMGADISIERDRALFRVQDVKGGSFVIKTKSGETRVPMNYSAMPVKIEHTLKLVERGAAIEKLKAERAYSYGTDPRRAAVENKSMGDAIAQEYKNLENQEIAKDLQAESYTEANADLGMKGFRMMPGSERDSAGFRNSPGAGGATGVNGQALGASAFGKIDGAGSPDFMRKMNDDLSAGAFDAMEVSFEVTSDKPYLDPYLVIIAQYREKADARESRLWVYAQALDSITEKKQKVYVRKGGFRPGFELQSYQIHLYNHGEEIATNVADNRVDLTREEAFQYLQLQYVGTNKTTTAPPRRALGKLPLEIRDRMGPDLFRRTYYAKIDPTGKPLGVFADYRCSEPAASFLTDAVGEVLFLPALEKGKPVNGIAELRLAEMSQ
jgi:hypothetical protein